MGQRYKIHRYFGGQCSGEKGLKTKQSQFKLHFSFVPCEAEVVPIHISLKINLKPVTVNCVMWASSHRWGHGVPGQHLLIFFHLCWATQWFGGDEQSLSRGHVSWWPSRSAVPWPPPCSETPLKWSKVSKCKFPENFFSMEQHFQTVYLTIYLWARSLSIRPYLPIEREIEIGVVGTFSTLPQINKQSNFKEKPLCS